MASFDRLARWYPVLEKWLDGGVMQRARLGLLDQLDPPERVLFIGEGPGKLVEAIGQRFPEAVMTCVDVSEAMMELGRQGSLARRCEWIRADIRADPVPDGPWDLVVTSFLLDCFTEDELSNVVPKLADGLGANGEWLQVDFQVPEKGGFWALRARLVIWLLYRFFRATTDLSAEALVPPQPLLLASGMMLKERRTFDRGLAYAEIWQRPQSEGRLQASAGASAADC